MVKNYNNVYIHIIYIYLYMCIHVHIHGNMPAMNICTCMYTHTSSQIFFFLRVVCKAHVGTYFHLINFCMLSKKNE